MFYVRSEDGSFVRRVPYSASDFDRTTGLLGQEAAFAWRSNYRLICTCHKSRPVEVPVRTARGEFHWRRHSGTHSAGCCFADARDFTERPAALYFRRFLDHLESAPSTGNPWEALDACAYKLSGETSRSLVSTIEPEGAGSYHLRAPAARSLTPVKFRCPLIDVRLNRPGTVPLALIKTIQTKGQGAIIKSAALFSAVLLPHPVPAVTEADASFLLTLKTLLRTRPSAGLGGFVVDESGIHRFNSRRGLVSVLGPCATPPDNQLWVLRDRFVDSREYRIRAASQIL